MVLSVLNNNEDLVPFLIEGLVGATSETPNFGVVKQAAEADAGVKTEQVETNKQTDQNVVAAEGMQTRQTVQLLIKHSKNK